MSPLVNDGDHLCPLSLCPYILFHVTLTFLLRGLTKTLYLIPSSFFGIIWLAPHNDGNWRTCGYGIVMPDHNSYGH